MQELARAKVNLSLHVVGKRQDGMHLLDSIVVFPNVGDILRVEGEGLTLSGPFAGGLSSHDNLVLQAASLLGPPPGLHLVKNLPVASGIGGGSADAAAALRLLATAEIPDALALGADIPACLISKPLRMQGVGERLTRLPALPDFAIVLVNSNEAVSTSAVFGALENVDNPSSSAMPAGLTATAFFDFLAAQRNDMQAAAIKICPSIALVIKALSAQPNCALARMSGSGGTCFGLFENLEQASNAALAIKRENPEWWAVAAQG